MATVEADVTPLERELIIYEKGIPELLEVDTPLLQMIDRVDSDPASNRATRIPLLTATKGAFQQANMNDANLGATSGPSWSVATLSPIYFTHGVSYSALAEYATQGNERGVKNAVQETLRISLRQFRAALDMVLNTAGNGVLATVTSVAGAVLTLQTDGFREQLFYVGMPIQTTNAALTVLRGTATVTAIDREAQTVTLDALPAGTVATDKVTIQGLTVPITIQSSLFGIQYHQSDATSGLWLALDRAVLPQVRTRSVNASSSALTTAFIRRALNKIRESVGDEQISTGAAKLVAYMHPAQADSYESLAVTISQIIKNPTGTQSVDLLFSNVEGMMMSGVPVKQSIHQDRTRIDFPCLSYWGRIVATDQGYYKVGDQFLFPRYNATGDGLFSSKFFYLKAGFQVYNRNPLSGSYIKTLALPANY